MTAPGPLPAGRILLVVPARAEGERLDVALAALLPERSRRSLRDAIARGEIEIGGKSVRIASRRVVRGDLVTLPGAESELPSPPLLTRLADGPDWCAFDKPAGLLSEPASATGIRDSLTTSLEAARRIFALETGPGAFAGCVGRLDRPVSGLLLVARSGEAHGRLVAELARPAARKIYLAVVESPPPGAEGTIDLPIRRIGPRQFAVVRGGEPVTADAKPARSAWRLVATGPGGALVAVRLLTGRTHQARLHLAALGCPIVGDTVYGSSPTGAPPARVFLHAHRLELTDRGAPLELVSPLPADFLDECGRRGLGVPDGTPGTLFSGL